MVVQDELEYLVILECQVNVASKSRDKANQNINDVEKSINLIVVEIEKTGDLKISLKLLHTIYFL